MADKYDPLTGELIPPESIQGGDDKQSAAPVDINDPVALKSLAMEALEEIVRTAPRNVSLVGAIRELIDRIDGKAPQSVSMTVKTDPVSKLTDDQLAAILANLPNNPMVIPPMPKKLG